MATQPTSPLIDDRYLLLDRLGRGGMASVFRGFDRIDQRVVAIKMLQDGHETGLAHPLSVEFDLWSRTDHPNVIRVYRMAVARCGPLDPRTPYLVLECGGEPVHRTGGPPGRLEASEVARLGVQMLHAMQHLDSAGLVHRDIKPANILCLGTGDRRTYKLTDFGLAVERGRREPFGRLSGSIPYVAPECLLGGALDTRTDLYSLGITLFRMATGRLPATETGTEAVLRWHLSGEPADPRRVVPGFPDRLARFIARLTQRDPRKRPSGPAEALDDLAPLESAPVTPSLAVDPSMRTRLRLALDAARLGAFREFELSSRGPAHGSLIRQLRTWSELFELGFFDLGSCAAGPSELAQTVLALLLELGHAGPEAVRRFGLDRTLPLTLVHGVPVLDRCKPPPGPASAESVAAFILNRATCRGLVILAASPKSSCAGTRRTIALLRRRLDGRIPPSGGRRGLLLLRCTP